MSLTLKLRCSTLQTLLRQRFCPTLPAPAQGEGYVCKVCGYFHEGSELPDDFVCPLCKHGKEDFEHIVPEVKQPVKGYVCTVCDHFVECDGELPDDYVCPICNHGKEAFEPAVR